MSNPYQLLNTMIIYESKTTDWIKSNPCDSNNHGDVTLPEYEDQLILTGKDKWIKAFPDGSITYSLSTSDTKLLCDSAKVAMFSLQRTRLYEEELAELEKKVKRYDTRRQIFCENQSPFSKRWTLFLWTSFQRQRNSHIFSHQ